MRKTLMVLLAVAFWLFSSACGKVYEAEELPNTFELPTGAEIHVEPTHRIDLAVLKAGDAFAGVLAKPLFCIRYIREALKSDGDTFERKTLVEFRAAKGAESSPKDQRKPVVLSRPGSPSPVKPMKKEDHHESIDSVDDCVLPGVLRPVCGRGQGGCP